MILLAIDPGIRGAGAVLFRGGELLRAAYVLSFAASGSGPREAAAVARAVENWVGSVVGEDVDALVLEWPQVYCRGGGRTKADPNLLLPLAAVDGALAAIFSPCDVEHFMPHDWKGNTEKPEKVSELYAIATRVLERLSPEERARVDRPRNRRHGWDVADAVGIGLFALGRFDKRRVIHRE